MTDVSLNRQDISDAVKRQLITEKQAAGLMSIGHARLGAVANVEADDEPFEFFRGFNEVFLCVGLLLFLGAFCAVFSSGIAAFPGILLTWYLGEYFLRKRRMVLPGFVISSFFAAFVGFSSFSLLAASWDTGEEGLMPSSLDLVVLLLVILGGVYAFYHRFKTPFALYLLSIGMSFLLVTVSAILVGGEVGAIKEGSRPGLEFYQQYWSTTDALNVVVANLVFGVGAFFFAMKYDVQDPHRVARYSQNGFWLHLIAGYSLVSTLAGAMHDDATSLSMIALAVVLILLSIVSIIVDRRPLLMSAVAYLAFVWGRAVQESFENLSSSWIILVVGAFVIVLASKWGAWRNAMMRALPEFPYKKQLPPYS